MEFEDALAFVFKWEGGESNDQDDAGGHTKYGISQKAYPHLNISALTRDQAAEIYRTDYWDRIKAEQLPPILRLAAFDAAVNTGIKRSAKLLQSALKVRQDGAIGPVTLQAAQNAEQTALINMLARRAMFYVGLVAKKPKYSKYLFGWFRRLFDLSIHAR